jgi:hypothetical protein
MMTRSRISAVAAACVLGSAVVNWRFGVLSGVTQPWLFLWGIVALGLLAFWFLTVPLFSLGAVLLVTGIRKASAREALAGTAIICATWIALGALFCFGDMEP